MTPPRLHMHPIRRDILRFVALYSTNGSDSTFPEGCPRWILLEIIEWQVT